MPLPDLPAELPALQDLADDPAIVPPDLEDDPALALGFRLGVAEIRRTIDRNRRSPSQDLSPRSPRPDSRTPQELMTRRGWLRAYRRRVLAPPAENEVDD